MSKYSLEEMLANAVHFGQKTSKWNSKMAPYLHGERNGVHIFNLEKTAECLEEAMAFVRKSASEDKVILVVSTKVQTLNLIPEECEKLAVPYVVHKWYGGLLTNFQTIKARVNYLKKMKEQLASGEVEKYTKKEQVEIRKEVVKLQNALGGVENMKKVPDVLFVVDAVRDHIAIVEAKRLKIPVVAICDSNADPTEVDFPIPANDDAIKSLKYILGHLFTEIAAGRRAPAKVTPVENAEGSKGGAHVVKPRVLGNAPKEEKSEPREHHVKPAHHAAK